MIAVNKYIYPYYHQHNQYIGYIHHPIQFFPTFSPRQLLILFLYRLVSSIVSYNTIIWNICFFVCLISLSIIFLRFKHTLCLSVVCFFLLLKSYPFYGYIAIYLSIPLSMDIWIVSRLLWMKILKSTKIIHFLW